MVVVHEMDTLSASPLKPHKGKNCNDDDRYIGPSTSTCIIH